MTKGTLSKVLVDELEATCVLDESLHDYVEIEHQAIRDGFNELFTFIAIRLDEILYWGEETSIEEEEETELSIEEPISEEEAEAIMNVSLSFSK